jgi:hypothetical protein
MHNCTQPLIWRWTSGLGFVHLCTGKPSASDTDPLRGGANPFRALGGAHMTVHARFASWSSPLIRCGPKKPEMASQPGGQLLRSVLGRAGPDTCLQ